MPRATQSICTRRWRFEIKLFIICIDGKKVLLSLTSMMDDDDEKGNVRMKRKVQRKNGNEDRKNEQ